MASGPEPASAGRTDRTRPLRFVVAGGVNTLFGFAVYGLTAWAGWPTWVCLLVGNLAGTAFNFLTLGGYVFRDLRRQRLPRFIAVYALVYLLNLGLLTVFQAWGVHRLTGQFVLLVPMAAMSYVLMNKLVFRPDRSVVA